MRRSSFNQTEIGTSPEIEPEFTESMNVAQQIELDKLKDRKANRGLRIIYALIAVCFAIASIMFWMRFIQFYYDPQKHSDTFFATLTTACTINILAAFISIIKGLFPNRKA